MKVLLVNKFHYMKGGAESYYFTLADIFKKQGHEVIFFSMKHEKNYRNIISNNSCVSLGGLRW